jgi:hypothetical protein
MAIPVSAMSPPLLQFLVASCYILIIKPTDALISQIYFWNRTLHVSDSLSVICMYCSVYSARLLMMERETGRNM